MQEKVLEQYLHENIPITQSMEVYVEHVSLLKVILAAPISKNINHKKTVFGGSLHSMTTLACWSLIYVNLKGLIESSEIVITHSDIQYLAPVSTDFTATCERPDEVAWQRFMQGLKLKGKARIELRARIYQKDKLAVDFLGTFAALKV